MLSLTSFPAAAGSCFQDKTADRRTQRPACEESGTTRTRFLLSGWEKIKAKCCFGWHILCSTCKDAIFPTLGMAVISKSSRRFAWRVSRWIITCKWQEHLKERKIQSNISFMLFQQLQHLKASSIYELIMIITTIIHSPCDYTTLKEPFDTSSFSSPILFISSRSRNLIIFAPPRPLYVSSRRFLLVHPDFTSRFYSVSIHLAQVFFSHLSFSLTSSLSSVSRPSISDYTQPWSN